MVQAILVLQQIEQNTKGNSNSGILKSNRIIARNFEITEGNWKYFHAGETLILQQGRR